MKRILLFAFIILMLTTTLAYADMSVLFGSYTGLQNVNAGGQVQGTKATFYGFTYGGGGRYSHESYVFYNKKNGISFLNTGGGVLFNIVETGSDRVKVVPYFTFGMGTTLTFGTFNANNVTSNASQFGAQATICVATGVKTYFSEKFGVRFDVRMFKPFSLTNSLTEQLQNVAGATTNENANKPNWAVSAGVTFKM